MVSACFLARDYCIASSREESFRLDLSTRPYLSQRVRSRLHSRKHAWRLTSSNASGGFRVVYVHARVRQPSKLVRLDIGGRANSLLNCAVWRPNITTMSSAGESSVRTSPHLVSELNPKGIRPYVFRYLLQVYTS